MYAMPNMEQKEKGVLKYDMTHRNVQTLSPSHHHNHGDIAKVGETPRNSNEGINRGSTRSWIDTTALILGTRRVEMIFKNFQMPEALGWMMIVENLKNHYVIPPVVSVSGLERERLGCLVNIRHFHSIKFYISPTYTESSGCSHRHRWGKIVYFEYVTKWSCYALYVTVPHQVQCILTAFSCICYACKYS